jgi:hypothetical protein
MSIIRQGNFLNLCQSNQILTNFEIDYQNLLLATVFLFPECDLVFTFQHLLDNCFLN